MKSVVALLFVLAYSMVLGEDKANARTIALPSPGLMRCETAQLWQVERTEASAVYPVQVSVDNFDKNGCPLGIVAVYDKSVPIDEIKAALDHRYGKWGMIDKNGMKLYRVEPESFAIQLTRIHGGHMRTFGQEGMTQVIYLSFSLSQRSGGF